ncbi:helix-turn-helix transcriptional regulator [Glycomyces sp. NPDC021274]|uniref:helix-turn-helix transcriptional regulator n=1 Tax=Glycomyces sp. NPDC021274 TaxID=3155120 RepID=UPI0033FD4723
MDSQKLDQPEAKAAQEVYRLMRTNCATLEQAVAQAGLPGTDLPLVRGHLIGLGLLDGTAEVAMDAASALSRMLGEGRDRLAEALQAVAERQGAALDLAEHYLRLADDAKPRPDIEILRRDERFRPRIEAVLDELAGGCRREHAQMHPHVVWSPADFEASLRRDKVLAGRGIGFRSIYSQLTLRGKVIQPLIERKVELGGQVKAAPLVPVRMVVYDREQAIIDFPPDPGIGAIVVRDPMLAAPLAAFFDYCWTTASGMDDVLRGSDDTGLSDQQRAVVRMLASGAKDEAIARSLGVSVRTVTRIVADLTAQLGATSRFQAGVQAARLGWLD